ncbi:MAG: carbohydrate kinase family protein [Aquamicrobium sp.]|nr:carbohydrate kinase family protein [Aquamicrobium sp.]
MIRPRLFAAGAAHIDRRGRLAGAYVPAASNPGTMSEEVGGGAFNALRNAVRHGVDGSILSLRGGDVAGDAVARAIADAVIGDLSAVFLDRTTPSYTALIDAEGELIAGFADMGLYEIGFPKQVRRSKVRHAVAGADAVLCEANMPATATEALVSQAGDRPVFAIGISPAKVGRLVGVLARLSCLFMNANEARTLAGLESGADVVEAGRVLRDKGLARAVITSGGAPLTAFDAGGIFTIAPSPARFVADVTGAGDAIAGVTVAYLMRGFGFAEALRHGMAAARLTVEASTVVADYDDKAFEAALALVGHPAPVA